MFVWHWVKLHDQHMVKTRRIIRKTRPARSLRLDEQVWPLVIAFCVLGGFLAGAALAYLRLDDPRWYANAWTYLIAIPLVISALLIALAVTGNRLLRRTMQLALVLGIIFHIMLFIAAVETDVFHRVWTEVLASTEHLPKKEVVKVPDYTSWQHDSHRQAQREFNQPVETAVPDPVVAPTPRATLEEEPVDVPMAQRAAPQSRMVPSPDVVRREQVNQAVPRQRDRRSKLSRRDAELPPNPTQAVPLPDLVRQPQRRPDVPRPGMSGTPKKTQPIVSERPARSTPTPVPQRDQTVQLSRQTPRSNLPQQRSSAAALPRRESRSGIVPRADVQVADKPAVARRNQTAVAQPNNTTARKQQTRSVTQRAQVALPTPTMADDSVTRRRSPQQPAPHQPTLAQTPRQVESQRPRLTTRPALTSPADVPATNNVARVAVLAASAPEARPLATTRTTLAEAVERQATQAVPQSETSAQRVLPASPRRAVAQTNRPQAATVPAVLPGQRTARAKAVGSMPQRVSPQASEATAQKPAPPAPSAVAATRATVAAPASGNAAKQRRFPSVDMQGAAARPQVAPRQLTRRSANVRPSLREQAGANQPARRSTRIARRAAAPVMAENPQRRRAPSNRASAQAAPASIVLSKAQTGTAGRGAAANLGLSDPAVNSPASVASGSAQRATATQNLAPGPALSPQAPALVRDGRAGQTRPSAVLRATPLVPATRAGSRNPKAVNANASAALTQAAAAAQRGQVTASKGTIEVDLGPTTLVAQSGTGRASGGGQPQRRPGIQSRTLARSVQGQSLSASLLAEVVRPAVAAPAAEGGGVPSRVDLESNPNASVNARAQPNAPAWGGAVAAAGGVVNAPNRSLAVSSRRATAVSDGPQLAEPSSRVPFASRKATRNRQLEGAASVVDLSAGNADQRNDRQMPSTMLAANAAATAVGKQTAGGQGEKLVEINAISAPTARASGSVDGALAARAEAVDAPSGLAVAGGGSRTPLRSGHGPQLSVDTHAEQLEVAGAMSSSGRKEAEPQSTQGTLITRLAGGVDAPRNDDRVGALQAKLAVDAVQRDLVGTGLARRAASTSSIDGPAVHGESTASPLSKRTLPTLSMTPVEVAAEPGTPLGTPAQNDEESQPGPISDWPSKGTVSALAGVAMPVQIDAVSGPGGLDRSVTVEVGVRDRRSSELSDQVQLKVARFARQKVGGMPDLNTSVPVAAEPFRHRARRGQGAGDPAEGAGPETEEAIDLGLVYLSRMQADDGRWTLNVSADQDGLPQLASDTAATGLALLAFQGAGYHHRDYRYASVVRGGVDFLVRNQKADGNLYVSMDQSSNQVVALYSHSIAALALSEAYGMTQDPTLREPAQKALDFIAQTQHPKRGGWRYTPGIGSDTSVTGWMMMALKSGQLANLDVPSDTYARIRKWLDRAQKSSAEPYLYCYNPYAPNTPKQKAGRLPSKTMTAVGLLMRLYSGWRRDHANMIRGADYLLKSPPANGTTLNPRRDTYYWYYATQVMFHMGGQYWNAWNQRLHPLLIGTQTRTGALAGSWDPRRPVPDKWASFGGRLYVTTMNLLSLEVTYRHLPLYEETAR